MIYPKLLDGKIAIVTGSSRGIGAEISNTLGSCGAKIAICYNTNRINAEQVRKKIIADGSEAEIFKCDVSGVSHIEKVLRLIIKRFKKVDILINNAGVIKQTDFEKITEEEYDWILDTNLKGVFFFSQAIIPYLVKTKGTIINISSIGGQRGGLKAPHYSASKAAVISLTKSLSNIYAPKGVRVNAISPGQIETDRTKEIFKTDYYQKNVLPRIPLGRVGTAKEVTYVALFLASEWSSYITGQTINVNGGEYLN